MGGIGNILFDNALWKIIGKWYLIANEELARNVMWLQKTKTKQKSNFKLGKQNLNF